MLTMLLTFALTATCTVHTHIYGTDTIPNQSYFSPCCYTEVLCFVVLIWPDTLTNKSLERRNGKNNDFLREKDGLGSLNIMLFSRAIKFYGLHRRGSHICGWWIMYILENKFRIIWVVLFLKFLNQKEASSDSNSVGLAADRPVPAENAWWWIRAELEVSSDLGSVGVSNCRWQQLVFILAIPSTDA